jgi:hypothetical protein
MELELVDWPEPIVVTMTWSRDDPYAVGLRFPGEPGVYWLVAREVLTAGLAGPAGLGDVAVFPDLFDPGYIELVLSSPDGAVGLRVPLLKLVAFLNETWRHVLPGTEVQPWPHFAADGLPEV